MSLVSVPLGKCGGGVTVVVVVLTAWRKCQKVSLRGKLKSILYMQSCDATANTLKSPSTLVVKLIFSGSLLMVGFSAHTATISALYLVPPLRPLTLKALVEWVVVDMDMGLPAG